ncbi:dual specificity calcium/calmodulin-dependent 3',5'-cyclic nucleotide phosphodiesterase 1 isoform X2 [Danaus plexippus]|uniref:dual specificity calcium/calmodulin-dependent 3',5'-cyclic nucleotide phosphodiesterase 1 isoform X2 n=1 Tax=Danaus plexippus TaxID=13037 RepID=UPI002AB0D278|nr:dual specificity calcium/calmodulin-dependent 3',5'-cyclic nucleotide phosphodiesterase 1 isoform X2 [Danaus plexippus]XP_061385886.1 dual specificity calcium/calmodulin-dependent 3',5'-cyclic nucleotide phosphodiesterase 1 isoform X2 [Danaus plexippus]XP_061385891.1 dual specificity calcium/calmodulin-dependent 3',5'-cyclic nucleotide phosphodiesterase 1 isoform X2 [Danaus plexippus]
MMRRGKALLEGSRQGSVDGSSNLANDKELVHKCHSDPGGGRALGAAPRTHRHRSVSGALRKCVLTLDGYSYVIVASPPGGVGAAREEPRPPPPPVPRNSSPKQGALTIVRRSSSRGKTESSPPTDEQLDQLDLDTEHLPAVDTPDACDKAALRLRYLLRQLNKGEIPAETLQKNLQYAAKVLEAVYIDETKPAVARQQSAPTLVFRRLADEDDELSEVQPDAVPPEVREWLASTFTRQLATAKRKSDEKPKFRSVAHAIRAGIFVDRIYRRVTSTALMQFPQDVVRVLKTLDEWSFDVFALHEAAAGMPVKYLGYELLNRYGMIHKFKVPPTILENFLSRIEEGYCRFHNPYHNNLHAADVAQTVHYMLCQTGLMNWLSDLEIFATLVAAIVHDYEHTGTTNNFHVMSGSDTALLYNDRAVLENHHISAAFRLLRDEECNILQNLSRDEFREFRTLVIDMVLATDMSFHFQQLKNMRSLLSLAEPTVDKSKAASLVLHCCDISHPAKRWDLHHRWTMSLLDEFFLQGDKERELGLPFSPLCDRNNTLVAESQIGFIDFIVEPSMGVCADMLECILGPLHSSTKNSTSTAGPESISEESSGTEPSTKFKIKKPWVACLTDNKKIWKEQAAKDAEARAKLEEETNGTSPPADE